MLYGMADPIKDALVRLGQRVRVYTPYGQLLPGMAYLVRRLLENTANESFLRASFTEHVPEEKLLMNPMQNAGNPHCGSARDTAGDCDRIRSRFHERAADRLQPRSEPRRRCRRRSPQVAKQLGRTYPLGHRRPDDARPAS